MTGVAENLKDSSLLRGAYGSVGWQMMVTFRDFSKEKKCLNLVVPVLFLGGWKW